MSKARTGNALIREEGNKVVRPANRVQNGWLPSLSWQQIAVEPNPDRCLTIEVIKKPFGLSAIRVSVAKEYLLHSRISAHHSHLRFVVAEGATRCEQNLD